MAGLTTCPFQVFDPSQHEAFKDGPIGLPDTAIGNDVRICHYALILPGVTVGDGAIVGAGAIVSRDVAPYTIVAGNPARTVRLRFPPKTVAALLQLRWWTGRLNGSKPPIRRFCSRTSPVCRRWLGTLYPAIPAGPRSSGPGGHDQHRRKSDRPTYRPVSQPEAGEPLDQPHRPRGAQARDDQARQPRRDQAGQDRGKAGRDHRDLHRVSLPLLSSRQRDKAFDCMESLDLPRGLP